MSSRFEGFGMVLVEAMAQGVPCISYDCPAGPSDIIKNGEDGILVKNQDSSAMIYAIETLIINQDLRKKLGKAAFTNVEKYEVNNIVNLWMELFTEKTLNNITNLKS